LVKELPRAVLFALLAFGVIAAAMALNAYLQRRRAKSLAGQRAALLSDVGVLQAALLPAVRETLGELDVSVAYRPAKGLPPEVISSTCSLVRADRYLTGELGDGFATVIVSG